MKRCIVLFMITVLVSAISFAQTSREQVEKAMKDPKAAENAAKADALLIDKKNIKDSARFAGGMTATSAKKERCLFNRKKKSAKYL